MYVRVYLGTTCVSVSVCRDTNLVLLVLLSRPLLRPFNRSRSPPPESHHAPKTNTRLALPLVSSQPSSSSCTDNMRHIRTGDKDTSSIRPHSYLIPPLNPPETRPVPSLPPPGLVYRCHLCPHSNTYPPRLVRVPPLHLTVVTLLV